MCEVGRRTQAGRRLEQHFVHDTIKHAHVFVWNVHKGEGESHHQDEIVGCTRSCDCAYRAGRVSQDVDIISVHHRVLATLCMCTSRTLQHALQGVGSSFCGMSFGMAGTFLDQKFMPQSGASGSYCGALSAAIMETCITHAFPSRNRPTLPETSLKS